MSETRFSRDRSESLPYALELIFNEAKGLNTIPDTWLSYSLTSQSDTFITPGRRTSLDKEAWLALDNVARPTDVRCRDDIKEIHFHFTTVQDVFFKPSSISTIIGSNIHHQDQISLRRHIGRTHVELASPAGSGFCKNLVLPRLPAFRRLLRQSQFGVRHCRWLH